VRSGYMLQVALDVVWLPWRRMSLPLRPGLDAGVKTARSWSETALATSTRGHMRGGKSDCCGEGVFDLGSDPVVG
jgi:hypothetical protein